MSDIVTQMGSMTDADYEAVSLKMLDEMSHLEELMDIKRVENDRIKLENAAVKAHTEAKLIRLEQQVSKLSEAK